MNLCDSCSKTDICPWSCSDGCTECKDYNKQTNEEYIKHCDTEQKTKKRIIEWLKQPHHNKVEK